MRSKKTNIEIIPLKKPRKIRMMVGLTGGFGTGKTTVARMFKRLGAQVIDCDKLAHQALNPNTSTFRAVCDHFGRKNILGRDGKIDRRKLANIVFDHPARRKTLEAVIHPYVFSRVERIAKGKSGMVILEVPLLFETDFDKKMDANIVVWAGYKRQSERLRKGRNISADELRARMKAQIPLGRKAVKADFVIDNDGSINETKNQVSEIWNRLKLMMKKEKV